MQTQFVRAVASEKTAEGTKDTKAPLSGELFVLHLRAVFQKQRRKRKTCTLTIGLNANNQFKVAQQTMVRAMIGETPKALKYKIRNEIIRHQFIERKRFDYLARELI